MRTLTIYRKLKLFGYTLADGGTGRFNYSITGPCKNAVHHDHYGVKWDVNANNWSKIRFICLALYKIFIALERPDSLNVKYAHDCVEIIGAGCQVLRYLFYTRKWWLWVWLWYCYNLASIKRYDLHMEALIIRRVTPSYCIKICWPRIQYDMMPLLPVNRISFHSAWM